MTSMIIVRTISLITILSSIPVEGMLDFSSHTHVAPSSASPPFKPTLSRLRIPDDLTSGPNPTPKTNHNQHHNNPNLNKEVADDFGKIVDDTNGDPWRRILIDQSYYHDPSCNIDIQLQCYLASDPRITCKDYMDTLARGASSSCQADVVYEVSATNIGLSSETVQTIKIAIDGERPFTRIDPHGNTDDDQLQGGGYLLAPGETLTSDLMPRSLSFCSSYERQGGVPAEVVLECTEGLPVMQKRSYAFDPIPPPTCSAVLDITSCETTDGGPCQPVPMSGLCTFRPLYFDFLFSGGICSESHNSQTPYHFRCNDHGDVSVLPRAFMVVQGVKSKDIYFAGFVSKHEVFTVGGTGRKVDSNMKVLVFPDKPTHGSVSTAVQTFYFHSSCSKDIFLNDVFGGVTIVGFRNKYNNITSDLLESPPDYKLTYKIDNHGDNHILFNNLTFAADDNDDVTLVPNNQSPILARDSLYGDAVVSFNITSPSCFDVRARLVYETLPGFSSKICTAEAEYTTGTGGKGSKNGRRTSKKGSKRTSACQAKSNKSPSSKTKGKGSYSKGSKKGSKGKSGSIGHPSKGSLGSKKHSGTGKGKAGQDQKQPSKGSKSSNKDSDSPSKGKGSTNTKPSYSKKGTKGGGDMNQYHPSKGGGTKGHAPSKVAKGKGVGKGSRDFLPSPKAGSPSKSGKSKGYVKNTKSSKKFQQSKGSKSGKSKSSKVLVDKKGGKGKSK